MNLTTNKRALFASGRQSAFLYAIQEKISITEIAKVCECSERTIRDWRREKFTMPLECVGILAEIAEIPIPVFTIQNQYAHTSLAGIKGYQKTKERYGEIPQNEFSRAASWKLWWKKTGRYKEHPILFKSKEVTIPEPSIELAEFIGVMIGDGGLTTYQATISLNHITDLEYSNFIITLIQKLFGYSPALTYRPKMSLINIVISRVRIVEHLHRLGLPIGNKILQHLDIPNWIKGDQEFSIACVRGLVDTDGSVFTHTYLSKGKIYSYKKLSFTSASEPLIKSVFSIFESLNLHPRITRNGLDVRIESKNDITEYFRVVGSHNPKHLKRYVN